MLTATLTMRWKRRYESDQDSEPAAPGEDSFSALLADAGGGNQFSTISSTAAVDIDPNLDVDDTAAFLDSDEDGGGDEVFAEAEPSYSDESDSGDGDGVANDSIEAEMKRIADILERNNEVELARKISGASWCSLLRV